ncbi:MAG: hypothetical protein ACKVZJ_09855 [Phycisphaerales bacterium]
MSTNATPSPARSPAPPSFVMDTHPALMLAIAVALLAFATACDTALKALTWYYTNPEPILFFGNHKGLSDTTAMLKSFANTAGYALALFAVARLIAAAAPRWLKCTGATAPSS